MAHPEIRTADHRDVDAVLAFWARAAQGSSVSDDRTGLETLLARDPSALIIAEVDGTIVGTLIAGWDGWRCHLYRLAVDPDHRRSGIASTLLAVAEERFVEVGGRRADAMVRDDDETAHATWSAAGYQRQKTWARWIKPLLSSRTSRIG